VATVGEAVLTGELSQDGEPIQMSVAVAPEQVEVLAPPRPISVDEFLRMAAVGIFGEDERVELIQGGMVQMFAIGVPHAEVVDALNRDLHRQTAADVIIRVQNPIELPGGSAPQPDLVVVRADYQRGRLPQAADVLLVIEVGDTSAFHDRNRKLPLYAAAGIPETWLVDLNIPRLECHSEPGPDGYQQIALAGRGKSLSSTVLAGVTLSIDDVLPRPSSPDANPR
jgi:Uma2 family endonuclease